MQKINYGRMKPVQLFLPLCLLNFNLFGQTKETIAGKSIDTFITSKMKALGIPGMAVAVVKNGEKIKVSTYGMANLEWDRKVTPRSTFQIASTTKLLTSTLLLKALFNGKIKLEDPVEKYMDAVPPAWKDIQIKHLISHSSGLREFKGDTYASTATVIQSLKDSALQYVPGKGQQYAQADFMLLGYILEKIYGKPFTKLMADEVTVPLKMKDGGYDMEQKTGSFLRTNLIKEKVTTYYDLGGTLQAYKFIYPQYNYTAGGYFASINDMVNWAIGLDRESLFTKMFSQEYIFGRDSIGHKLSVYTRAGWILENENGVQYAGHSGGPGLADILRFPGEGYTFIVLANDGELLPYFARAIASFYITSLSSKPKIEKFDR
jgi:serine-type D-Ala-D-Ala carboxypeptidase